MGTDEQGNPACVICAGISDYKIQEVEFDFTGRMARCHCGNKEPSGPHLAFLQIGGDYQSVPEELRQRKLNAHKVFTKKMDEKVSCTVGDLYHARQFLKNRVDEANRLWKTFSNLEAECKSAATGDSYYCGCDGWD
jgi:hypothetical protein